MYNLEECAVSEPYILFLEPTLGTGLLEPTPQIE